MNISMISFTDQGQRLAEQIKAGLTNDSIKLCRKPEQGLIQWTAEQFAEQNAIVFVGACGIAVRAIAPSIKDKLKDSPVLVIDEGGHYVIPILSGHAGGANELAKRLAKLLDASAVITTATDIRHQFAADVFARKNNLTILNKDGIAKVSSKILRGEKISVAVEKENDSFYSSDYLPEGLVLVTYPPAKTTDIVISTDEKALEKAILQLKPKTCVLGIGCRSGKREADIDAFIHRKLREVHLTTEDIAVIASIDKKKDEQGICAWAAHHRIPYLTFSEERLRSVPGDFHGSSFVEKTVGVDNVCERSALAACGESGQLILEKQAENGMTLALAGRQWKIDWKGTNEDET